MDSHQLALLDRGRKLSEHEWIAYARAWLDELSTPVGLCASSVEGLFHTLFGRDTLWSVLLVQEASRLQPENTELAEWAAAFAMHNLRALALTQGTRLDDENEEQPGKIVHEFWSDPPERLLRENWPLRDGRYYGSADATYLFLMTAVAVWDQVADGRKIVAELWDSVYAALHWALEYGDVDGDGRVETQMRQPHGFGLRNQVWKDSADSLGADDSYDRPIAWVELQGYAIAAFRGMAKILHDRGEEDELQRKLARRVKQLKRGLEQFWLPAEHCSAIALTREKDPIPLVSSNVGHLLWCDALDEKRATATADRLMQPDILTAWGIRTLSSVSGAFDPNSYHRGSVWPFDSAIAAGALARMGRQTDVRQVAAGVLDALGHFGSPVELYCVIPDTWVRAPDIQDRELLVDYYRANATQAWSAASVLLCSSLLLTTNRE